MTTQAEVTKALRLISKAWGPNQSGYAFFPWIDREVQRRTGERRRGYNEGPSFHWPKEKDKIIEHMLAHTQHDLYWCPSLFEYPQRAEGYAKDEWALWADLDEADPRDMEYQPTIAWESSPGRYQAVWIADDGAQSFAGASFDGGANQRLTYYVGADHSGWDTTQLLRIPGWHNHKLEYEDDGGNPPKGKILWFSGPKYELEDFSELPEVQHGGGTVLTDALESDIDGVDRLEVIARVRLKLNHTARELLGAKDTGGADKSEKLWYLIRCLADEGLTVAEVVAVVRETVWNKFRDRHDELRRLIAEAGKAIAKRSDETIKKLESAGVEEVEDDTPKPAPTRMGELLKNIKKPKYLVKDILTEGACGFIAGEPKSYKSWLGLDLAFSVATGADFLNHFKVVDPGPVLYIQEEDPPATLKNRSAKIWVNKTVDKFELVRDAEGAGVWWLPPEQEALFDPDVDAYVQQGFQISNDAWQLWLDERLTAGMADRGPYRLLIIDTLMMTAGEVEENKSQEMTNKVFKPLKTLSRKHNCAVIVIHHMSKGEKSRPGQRMLGAVANHAWAEDSIYITHTGGDHLKVDTESKTIPGGSYRMENLKNTRWEPIINIWGEDAPQMEIENEDAQKPYRSRRAVKAKDEVLKLLDENGPMTTRALSEARGISRSAMHKQMARHLEAERVVVSPMPDGSSQWQLAKK